MTRAQSIALALTACAAQTRAELRREVFPVPPVVDAAFSTGGLAAFDPFDSWQGDNVRPASLLEPSSPGDDGARLPPGACFDVLPAWTARGFKPHDGTRVLYQPETQLLFAMFAPEDEAQVRAFCEWPTIMWMSEGSSYQYVVKQVLYRVTAYEVPAIGPGEWNFQPFTVAELLALPADARRILHRQSMIIRGGQRSKVEGVTTSPKNRWTTLTGMVVEAECTVGEDGSTIDLNNAPELAVRLDNDMPAVLSSTFPHLIPWGDSWLMEAGTLPGNPPGRIFQGFEALRVDGTIRDSQALARCRERWTGDIADAQPRPDGLTGRVLHILDFPPPPLLPPPNFSASPDDPFAAPKPAEEPMPPLVKVPDLFGETPVQDVSADITAVTGAPPGELQAWRRADHILFYIRGTPDGMAALTRWLDKDRLVESIGTALAEVTVRLLPPDETRERKTIWRSTISVRSGQRSGFRLKIGRPKEDEEAIPPACEVEMEAGREESNPFENDPLQWTIKAAATLRPPLVDAPVSLAETSETGTRHGVVLCRAIGRTAAGEDIVITLHVRETEVRTPWWSASPLQDWWWRRQLGKAGK